MKNEIEKIYFEPNACFPTELMLDFMNSRLPPFMSCLNGASYSMTELSSFLI